MVEKKITIHDIAKELNITASTVSRALSDHPRISDATKNNVLTAAKRMNYQPNSMAAALRKGSSKLVGILVPTINRNYFSSIVRGAEEVLNDAGYNVIISQSDDSPEKEIANLKALIEAQVDGIFISFAKETTNFHHLKELIDKQFPLILFDRTHDSLDVDAVVIDDYSAAYQATNHLISEGCFRIAHFTSNSELSIYSERLRGYKQALINNGLPIDEALIFKSALKLEDGRELGHKITSMDQIPDGVFSASDFSAIGAMQIVKQKGFNIPNDIKFFGFSNETFCEFTEPTLSSIDQLSIKTGKLLANIFIERVTKKETDHHPKRTVLKPTLILRQSSKS